MLIIGGHCVLARDLYPAWIDQPNTPVTYPLQYLELAREKGLDVSLLLAAAGLQPDQLADPTRRISLRAFLALIDALLAASADPGIGFETGLRLPLTAHGNLGYALLCSDTPLDAVTTLQRFWHLRGRGIRFDFRETADAYVFEFHGELPMSGPLGRILIEGMMISFCMGVQFLLGAPRFPGEVSFDFPEPAHYARFRERFPYIRYNQPATMIRLPDKQQFQRRLPTGNPEALRQAISLCEREYALWGADGVDHSLVAHARAEMTLQANGYPEPEVLATRLHLSLRTLRRKLQQLGSGYKILLEEARHRDALELLGNPALEIQEVAELLGYDIPANFTRAFRQWTGETPSRYRQRQHGRGQALTSDPDLRETPPDSPSASPSA